jgi:hypothetical protein
MSRPTFYWLANKNMTQLVLFGFSVGFKWFLEIAGSTQSDDQQKKNGWGCN